MEVIVLNNTEFTIVLGPDDTYFAAGKYVTKPKIPIMPGNFTAYAMTSSNIGGGVNGGNAWDVMFDDGTKWNFATGWIAPVRGGKEAGVAESSSPQDGNKAATVNGNSITSKSVYKNKEGQNIRFTASAAPHELYPTTYVIGTVKA
ncbi:hypothetical protein FRC01_004552 [Tulasnella sp. 417]|nr:hypothetical protein FRC01_004552 [Tulasnella sp. 417]